MNEEVNRMVVPIGGTDAYEWRRTGQVVTLGTLFMVLGKKWPALNIYYFYRTLRTVVTGRLIDSVTDFMRKHSARRPVELGPMEREPTYTGQWRV